VAGEAGKTAWGALGRLARSIRRRLQEEPDSAEALQQVQMQSDGGGALAVLAKAIEERA
jgi:hypothetical protein